MYNYTEQLIPGGTYHVYSRANGFEKVFKSADNYRFFLKKYELYISPIAKTFCYCLMPNHFHFLIEVREKKDIDKVTNANTRKSQVADRGDIASQQFSKLLNCYAKAFNKQQGRKGNLFIRPFKRKKISSESYLRNVIQYIHRNPIEAGFCFNLSDWKYSSYSQLLNNTNPRLDRNKVIQLFGDVDNFTFVHQNSPIPDR